MNNHYVYLITNKINGHMYVGQTTNIKKRWSEHSRPSRKKTAIEKAFNKYGKESFILRVLEIVDTQDEANVREKYWIEHFDTYKNKKHYNMHIGGNTQAGENNPMFGRKGIDCPLSKISKEEGLKIYNDYKNNIEETTRTLAIKYNSNVSTIFQICSGKHWTTEKMQSTMRANTGFIRSNCIEQSQALEIYNLYKNGIKNIEHLSLMYEVCTTVVREICMGVHWSTSGMQNLMPNTHTSSKITKEIGIEILNYFLNNNIKLKEVYLKFKQSYDVSYRTIQRICSKEHWSVKEAT